MNRRAEFHDDAAAMVDTNDRTRFKFGNGGIKQAVSRLDLNVFGNSQNGIISLSAVDTDDRYVPMLGSAQFLKRIGAVIDHETGEAIFKNLDSTRVVQLERSSSGLLMLDIVKDILDQEQLSRSDSLLQRAVSSPRNFSR